jgi:hypothetical protein
MKTWAKIEGGYIVAVATATRQPVGQWEELPAGAWPGWQARPSPAHKPKRMGDLVGWEDPRSVDEVRAARWEAIKAARDEFLDSHLPTPYGPFDCKPKDRQNITDAVALLQTLASIGQTGQTVTFTTAENQTVTLTLAQMTEVALLLGQRVQTAYAIGRAKRQALQEATTVAAADAVTWE